MPTTEGESWSTGKLTQQVPGACFGSRKFSGPTRCCWRMEATT